MSKWVWLKPERDLDDAKLEGPSVDTTTDLKGKMFIKEPNTSKGEKLYSYLVFDNNGYVANGTDGILIGDNGGSYKGSYRGAAKYSSEYLISNNSVVIGKTTQFKLSSDLKTLATDYKLVEDKKIYGCTDNYPSIVIGGLTDKDSYISDKDWCFQEASYISDDGTMELRYIVDSEVTYYRYFTSSNKKGSVCSRFLPDGFYTGTTYNEVTSDSTAGTITVGGVTLKFENRPTYSKDVTTADDLKFESFVFPAKTTVTVDGYKQTYNDVFSSDYTPTIDESKKTITINMWDTVNDSSFTNTLFKYKFLTDGVDLYVVNDSIEKAVENNYNDYADKYDYTSWHIGHDSAGKLYWFDEADTYKADVATEGYASLTWSIFNNSTYINTNGSNVSFCTSLTSTKYYSIYMPDGKTPMTSAQYKLYKASAVLVETPTKTSSSSDDSSSGYDSDDYSGYDDAYYSARMIIGDTGTTGYTLKDGTIFRLKKGDLSKDYTIVFNKYKTYTISFNYNSDYLKTLNVTCRYYMSTLPTYTYVAEEDFDTTITAPTFTITSGKSYFKGWNTKSDGTGMDLSDFVTPFKAGTHAEDYVFYAKWEK